MVWLDLSMQLDARTPVFPGDSRAEFTQVGKVGKTGVNTKRLSFSSHFGTHMDAPFHMLKTGKKLSDYPADAFVGQGWVFDVRGHKEIRLAETDLQKIQVRDFVFFLTGHSDNAYEADYFDGNPVVLKSTAHALIQRGVRLVGLDSFTPDNPPYEVHKMLFNHDVLIVENLVGLAPLAGLRVDIVALPLNINKGDGAPCRVIARPIE
ncbi:cyclase family protein [Candidatus Micrarchaeota archaeon]|nr:cyclase family protein [Candidatus Micrarchaeota archaeon]